MHSCGLLRTSTVATKSVTENVPYIILYANIWLDIVQYRGSFICIKFSIKMLHIYISANYIKKMELSISMTITLYVARGWVDYFVCDNIH